jgi:lantibiotic modifying enzyme
LARSALLPVLSFLESPLVYPRASLGAAVGLGSVIYALVKTSALLSDPSLLRAARKAAGLITSERIAEDRKFDVYDGAAGAILGLLSLYESVGDSSILMQARECGDHLIACRTASPSGHRVWKTGGGQAMSGLAHGVAGIAYALLRLSQATGRQHFLEAADEAICFERTAFSAAHGNWRAFGTSAENPVFWTAVCHGATGIGLARLGGLPMLDTPEIRDEIELAVDATKRHSWDGVDFLCCGNAGRIGLLSALAEERGRSELLERARSQAARLLELWRTRGGFRLQSDLPGPVDSPGFFRGTAGIGYEFLRLACPNRLPCVLLWR